MWQLVDYSNHSDIPTIYVQLQRRTGYWPQLKARLRSEYRDPWYLLANSCWAAGEFLPLWASAIANWLPRGTAACATRSRLIASVALIKRRTSSQPGPGPPRDTRLMWLRESEEEKMDQGREGGGNVSVSTSWKRLEGERCKNWKDEEHIANTSVLSNVELIYSSYKWFSLELSLTVIKPLQKMHVISLCLTSMVTSSCSHPVQNSHWITYCKMRRNWRSILNLWALNYGEIERHLGRIHKLDAAVPPRALSNSST